MNNNDDLEKWLIENGHFFVTELRKQLIYVIINETFTKRSDIIMAKANADSEAIRNFSKQVKQYVSQQTALINKLKSQYSAAGGQWNDLQYHKFGQALGELEKTIKKTEPAFTEYAKKLEGKAKQIDIYLGH